MRGLIFLATVLPAVVGLQVQIEFESSVLRLSIPATSQEDGIKDVVFHYIIKNVAFQGVGEHTRDGWQCVIRDVVVDGAEDITAYAEIYDLNGHMRLRTERSIFKLDTGVPAIRLPSRKMRGAVVFRDDFNSLDLGNWHQEVSMYGGMNWEFQVYTNDPQNTFTSNGYLYLQPTLTVNDPRFDENFLRNGIMDMEALFGTCTQSANYGCTRNGKYGLLPPIMSGKLMSTAGIRYGTVEVRARIPRGDWLWPAIWMLPINKEYGDWPRSGEIDIMESRGNTGDIGVGSVSSTLHWGPSWNQNRFFMTRGDKHTGSWADDFHTWVLEWSPYHLSCYVDGELIMFVDPGCGFWDKGGFGGDDIWAGGERMAPFDQEFYIILNVAVGGTNGYFPDNVDYGVPKPWVNGGGDSANDFWNARSQWEPTWDGDKAALVIDYVEMRNFY